MSCDRYRDALTDLAAGGTAPARLDAHLASCGRCREELAAVRRRLALAEAEMAQLVGAEPSPGLAVRIRAAVAEPEAARTWPLGWMWPAIAASVVLLAALAVWATRAPAPARVAVENEPATVPGEGRAAGPAQTRPAGPASPTAEPPQRARASEPPSPEARPLLAARGRRATDIIRHRGSPARGVPATPEVLVPRGETEALVRFAAIVHRDRQAPAAFLAAGRPSEDLAEPAELVIEPLEIVPLEPAGTPGT
jgi:hypothetical protein